MHIKRPLAYDFKIRKYQRLFRNNQVNKILFFTKYKDIFNIIIKQIEKKEKKEFGKEDFGNIQLKTNLIYINIWIIYILTLINITKLHLAIGHFQHLKNLSD